MSEELLLCEQVVLLAYDAVKGRKKWDAEPGPAISGAVLLDLLAAGSVREDNGLLRADGGTPPHPALARFHASIADSSKPRKVGHWVSKHAQSCKLERATAAALAERGILREERDRFLCVFPTTRYPQVDPGPEKLLLERLRAVLLENEDPTEREALLVGVLKAGKVLDSVVPKAQRRVARARAEEVAKSGIVNAAVAKAIRDVELAVTAAAVAATTAAACGSS